MDSAESAQELMEGVRIYYNFCREHSSLGKTPAEMVGVKLNLTDSKIESLMRIAAKNNRHT